MQLLVFPANLRARKKVLLRSPREHISASWVLRRVVLQDTAVAVREGPQNCDNRARGDLHESEPDDFVRHGLEPGLLLKKEVRKTNQHTKDSDTKFYLFLVLFFISIIMDQVVGSVGQSIMALSLGT